MKLGISVADMELLTLGELYDLIDEQAIDYEQMDDEQEDSVREATQEDFDIF